jgi:hypothetical protein
MIKTIKTNCCNTWKEPENRNLKMVYQNETKAMRYQGRSTKDI